MAAHARRGHTLSRKSFGDMRLAKLLAIVAACRALGVHHIIEQGDTVACRLIYAQMGFKVTPVELLPPFE